MFNYVEDEHPFHHATLCYEYITLCLVRSMNKEILEIPYRSTVCKTTSVITLLFYHDAKIITIL